jgi:large subunit ribosomal protein L18
VSIKRKVAASFERRKQRVRRKTRNAALPRVSVFKSASHIYAQLIDDAQMKTIVSCSTVEFKKASGTKKEVAQQIGKELAQRAVKAGIDAAIFDRGPFLFHGRVAALAEGLKEGGLRI